MKTKYDVIVIGGSFAGLSAALALGRARRNVLVVDSGKPCNRYTPNAHNLLTHDGTPPAEIREAAKKNVLAYPSVSVIDDLAREARQTKDGFELTTGAGKVITAKKLFFGTGVRDLLPDIPGFEACWGKTVIHCPYCHGYEVADQPTAFLAGPEEAMHMAKLLPQWTSNLTFVSNAVTGFTLSQLEYLRDHKIPVIQEPIQELLHSKGQLTDIVFASGPNLKVDALYARIPFQQHSDIPETLGCLLNSNGLLITDEMGMTTVEGVYAGGDNTTQMRSLANAIAAGSKAGAMINGALLD